MKRSLTMPPAPPVRRLIGPSFLLLALGLGSGEIILWPYLAANYGLGIVWAAVIGITLQFFINMEIERYALVRGESVFVGISKLWRFAPYWFIGSTFIGFALPGIIAASATALVALLGVGIDPRWIAIVLLLIIGLIVSSAPVVYKLLERITITIIACALPFLLLITLIVVDWSDVGALLAGLIGRGEGYQFLPAGIGLATFLGAFAYSGAGGNLNLAQSMYAIEKEYGMGAYGRKLSGLFSGKTESAITSLEGTPMSVTPTNITRFNQWWLAVNREHALVFWAGGLSAMLLLMLLSYASAFGVSGNDQSIYFVINEAAMIGGQTLGFVGSLFLLLIAVVLFQTQLSILDSTSRIITENIAIMRLRRGARVKLSQWYHRGIWVQINFGCVLLALGLSDPKTLIVLGASLNAVAMLVHIILVTIANQRLLPTETRPRPWRLLIIGIAILFFTGFCALVLLEPFR